jgi:HK97 family phage prohead protease
MAVIERRFVQQDAANVRVETREDGKPRINGYAARYYDGTPGTEYELWSGMRERIMPGAFDKAVGDGADVRALFNHDANQVLGRTKAGTLRLSADERGLPYEVDPPDTTTGRDVTELIRRGDVSGSSFAFRATDETWKKENGLDIREIRGVELFDVSPVTYPAYEGTSVQVRSADGAKASFEAWKASGEREHQTRANRVRLAEAESI